MEPETQTQSTIRRVLRSYPVRFAARLVGVIVLVAAGAALVARLGLLTDEAQTTTRPSERPAAEAATPPVPGQIQDGVWLVGSEAQPGTYRSAGGVDDRYCMWSRHSSASGGPMDDIIASDGGRTGQMLVTIEASDVLFRTRGCAPFTKVG